jgi:hypothetical protein
MNFHRVLPTLTVTAACAAAAVPVATAKADDDVQQASSENWSGYVVGGSTDEGASRSFKSVTGSWVQPAAKCERSSGSTYAAFWAGLGGAGDREALEQDGTEVNCSATGRASYYAWYELVPHAPVKVDLAVHPGDRMTATTTVAGHEVTESIVNDTTGQTFTRTLTMADPDISSAEWIAEAPSQCTASASDCTPLALSDFGKVTFTSATATDSDGHVGSISDSDWQTAAVTLRPSADEMNAAGAQFVSDTSSGGATPSKLSADGTSFSVAYRRSGGAQSGTSTGYGYGGGYGGGSAYGYGGSGGGVTVYVVPVPGGWAYVY